MVRLTPVSILLNTVQFLTFCKLLASTQKLHFQSTSPKDFYFPYKAVCALSLRQV